MRWYRRLFRKRLVEKQLDSELRFHLDQQIADYVATGMSLEEARRRARLEFGGLDQAKEECRDVGAARLFESLIQDLRYGLRQLRRNPGFTAVAVITLALGIGANIAIFSMINGILLRPLPVQNPDQLTFLGIARHRAADVQVNFSYPEFEEIRSQSQGLFSGMAALKFGGVEGGQSRPDGLTVKGQTRPIEMEFVTGNFFSMLGIQPKLGRFILSSEGAVAGRDPIIVLSYRYWATRFGRNPSIVGERGFVNGQPVTIVGIAPKGFFGVTPIIEIQGYMPLGMATIEDGVSPGFRADARARILTVIGRERATAHVGNTQALLHLIGERLIKSYPRNGGESSLRAYPLRPPGIITGPNLFGRVVGLFLVLVGLVLVLACMNVASLVLVRTTAREREMVIRAAVGAGRRRLLRQLLTESLLLALLGCGGGMLVGLLGSHALASISIPTELPMVLNFQFDWRVFAYAIAVAIVATVLVGIIPGIRASGVDLRAAAQSAGRGLTGGRQHLRQAFVALQVAGSLALLIVAGLFMRSLRSAQHANLGFSASHLLNLTLDPSEIGYTPKQGSTVYREVLDRVRALPGVRSASLALAVPLGDAVFSDSVTVPGRQLRPGQSPPSVLYNAVSPGYSKTLGIGLLRGRKLSDSDAENSARVGIVNQAMAMKFWPGQNPVGRQFTVGSDARHPIQIVGVVNNTRITSVSGPFEPCFYLPLAQHYASGATLQVRTAAAPAAMARTVVQAIGSVAPTVPILRVETMREALGGMNGLFGFEFGAELTGALGLLALVLAVVGIFGVTAYVVSQRTPEIGIRMALGAQPGDALKLVLGQGLKLAMIGIAVGVAVALGLARLLSGLLYGVKPTDPLTFAVVAVVLIGVTLLACYIPARRAAKVDPMVALRHE